VMSNAGLAIDAVLFRESYEAKNTVLEQTPARGQMVYEGSRITLYVARRGYMELLPAIFRRSDAVGRNLVRDICFIFEHMFGSIDETLDRGHSYYDPLECPPEFLPWLASWTAMVLDSGWPIEKKRALLKRSVDLYRIRGTTRGLALFLKLFIGHEPMIEENRWPFKGFRVGVDARIAIDTVVLPPVNLAHCFTVTVPMKFTDVTPEMVVRVHEIIQMEKPAHVQYYLRFAADEGDAQLREFFAIGLRSGIGIADEIVHAPAAPELHEASATVPTAPSPGAAPASKAEVKKSKPDTKAESKPAKSADKPDKTGK
jgi:phage tail-like protein